VVDFVRTWSEKTELPIVCFLDWLELSRAKFASWRQRYGKANEHNALVPRDHWLDEWERQAILDFHERYPLEGYRRLTFMMLDQDIVAVSPLFGLPRPGQGRRTGLRRLPLSAWQRCDGRPGWCLRSSAPSSR